MVVRLHCAVAQLQFRAALMLVAFTFWVVDGLCRVVDRRLCRCLHVRGCGGLRAGAWWASAMQCSFVELFHDLLASGCLKGDGLHFVGGYRE